MALIAQNLSKTEQTDDFTIKNHYICFINYILMNFTSHISRITYKESNLDFLQQKPLYFSCGIQMICIKGTGIISTGAQQYHLKPMSELIFWNGSILQLTSPSDDFFVRLILYPQKVFLQAAISLDHTYFKYMKDFPLYDHSQDHNNMQNWNNVNLWMDMAKMLFTSEPQAFGERLEQNYLQSMLMWIFNSIPYTYISPEQTFTRKQLLFHKFMHLIHEHASRAHKVGFYARKLCISQRYLHEIAILYSKGKTPKEIIEEQLTTEIKAQLNNPDLSISEIAEICQFPDSSYLSRFFKKSTGLTPKEYRIRTNTPQPNT